MLPGTTTDWDSTLLSPLDPLLSLSQTTEVIGFGSGARPEGGCAFIRDSMLHTLPVVRRQWNVDAKEDARCYARQHATM